MENQKTKSDLIRIRNTYSAKYGMEIDEWTAVILCEIEDNFKGLNKIQNESTNEIEKAAKLIKGQVSPLHFSTAKQAFGYAFAAKFLPLLILGIFSTYCWFTYCKYALQKEEKVNLLLFNNLIQNRQIITENGEMKLVLNHKNKKDKKYGAFYEYDRKNNLIIVPLVLKKDIQIDSNQFDLIKRASKFFK
jgi:hypothetical protein